MRARQFTTMASRLAFFSLLIVAPLAQAEEAADPITGWQLERDADPPSYALTEPLATDLNVETVVLTCAEVGKARSLQFELYLTDGGPLQPKVGNPATFDAERLKSNPKAEIDIDGRLFVAKVYFSEEYLVVADVLADRIPALSERLLDAIEAGQNMVMRFDLLDRPRTGPTASDGYVTVDLAHGGGKAVAAVRRCTEPDRHRVSSIEESFRLNPVHRF